MRSTLAALGVKINGLAIVRRHLNLEGKPQSVFSGPFSFINHPATCNPLSGLARHSIASEMCHEQF